MDPHGRLRVDAAKGSAEIRGRVRENDMHLDDLTTAREVAEPFSHRKADAVGLRRDLRKETTLNLDIAAHVLEGGGAAGLNASLVCAIPPAILA
jgi:hypothetical protein